MVGHHVTLVKERGNNAPVGTPTYRICRTNLLRSAAVDLDQRCRKIDQAGTWRERPSLEGCGGSGVAYLHQEVSAGSKYLPKELISAALERETGKRIALRHIGNCLVVSERYVSA